MGDKKRHKGGQWYSAKNETNNAGTKPKDRAQQKLGRLWSQAKSKKKCKCMIESNLMIKNRRETNKRREMGEGGGMGWELKGHSKKEKNE